MEKIMRELAERIENDLFATMTGPVQKQPQTALRLRCGRLETVQLDDAGNVVEPPPRCWKCGPVLACAEHFVCT